MSTHHRLEEKNNQLVLTVHASSYAEAVAISMKAFLLAEKLQHHPIVNTEYDKVKVEITTHDAGNKVTGQDREYMAELIKML